MILSCNHISKSYGIDTIPRYYRYLDELRAQKIERISSKELSKMMNVTASQIRPVWAKFQNAFTPHSTNFSATFLAGSFGSVNATISTLFSIRAKNR